VRLNQGFRKAGGFFEHFVCNVATHIRRDRHQSNERENRKAGLLQIVAICNEGNQEKGKTDHGADDRPMIQ
jgi:hypothetical protein